MTEIVRVLRLLEYVGERDWVEHTISNNGVKGERKCGGANVIREATIGQFPEIVEVKPENIDGLIDVYTFVSSRLGHYDNDSSREARLLQIAYQAVLDRIEAIPGFTKEVPDGPTDD